jgi:hypothetical protein
MMAMAMTTMLVIMPTVVMITPATSNGADGGL